MHRHGGLVELLLTDNNECGSFTHPLQPSALIGGRSGLLQPILLCCAAHGGRLQDRRWFSLACSHLARERVAPPAVLDSISSRRH
jgi:hypothetical protein